MLSRAISGLAHAAIAGAAMLLLTSGPSASFTLYSQSLDQPVAASGVEPVWWRHWGHWHRHGWSWHHWGWHHYYGYYHPYYYGYYRPYYYGYYQPHYYGYYRPFTDYWPHWHGQGDDDQD
jgi:hypothetical protein